MDDEDRDDIIVQDAEFDDMVAGLYSESAEEVLPETELPTQVGPIEAIAIEEPCGISWTPFLAYLAVWVVLCVSAVVLLRPAALDGGARWAPEYLYVAYAGIGMTAAGPLLSLVVWIAVRVRRERNARRGLFTSALVKGSVVTFTGAILWIVALYVLDMFASSILV
ncbi:MAG: hypothetical protein U1F44_04890 [Coriobacteriia bacterium]|nr:hypothetical protein [Coriobacteriia bacterium]